MLGRYILTSVSNTARILVSVFPIMTVLADTKSYSANALLEFYSNGVYQIHPVQHFLEGTMRFLHSFQAVEQRLWELAPPNPDYT